MIRILLADDHTLLRQGLKMMVSEIEGFTITDEASTGSEALQKVRDGVCDMIILDLALPDRSGLDVLKQIKSTHPKLPVLVLSMHSEAEYAERAFRAGASGYLTKESAPDQLMAAIRRVAEGGRYVSPSFAEKLAADLESVQRSEIPHERLSDREFEIFRLIVAGKSLKEIADVLCLSAKTVTTYRARIMDKMSMSSNAELVRYAVENRLIL